jgi:uncharacterized glyoxalase superfamily protein PhnB
MRKVLTMNLNKLTPNLVVADVTRTVEFYRDVLGFQFVMAVPDQSQEVLTEMPHNWKLAFAMMRSGKVEVMFQEFGSAVSERIVSAGSRIGGTAVLYIELAGLDKFHQRVKDRVKVLTDVHTTFYGMREFTIQDCNGYVLSFGEKTG